MTRWVHIYIVTETSAIMEGNVCVYAYIIYSMVI